MVYAGFSTTICKQYLALDPPPINATRSTCPTTHQVVPLHSYILDPYAIVYLIYKHYFMGIVLVMPPLM